MKEKLEKFKELSLLFKDKAEKIALLKNKYSEFSPISYDYIQNRGYDEGEWEVVFIERSRCGSDEEYTRYISEEEILTDLEVLEEKFKLEYDKKMLVKEKLKKDKEDKEKLQKENNEKMLYVKLKEKYEKSID